MILSLLFIIGATQSMAEEHPLYACFDALEQAEHFERRHAWFEDIAKTAKKTKSIHDLHSSTYTLHKTRIDSLYLPGVEQRSANDLAPRPFGLISTRPLDDAHLISILTADGIRSVKISSAHADRVFLGVVRKGALPERFTYAAVVSTSIYQVKDQWPADLENEQVVKGAPYSSASEITFVAKSYQSPSYIIDYNQPSSEKDLEAHEDLVREELRKVIRAVPGSFKAQKSFLSKLSKKQNRALSRLLYDRKTLTQKYARSYLDALGRCATLDRGLKNASLIAKQEISRLMKGKKASRRSK